MKISLRRIPLLALLTLSAATMACTATDESGTEGDEEDLTSLTARSRKLEFAGYVYVDENTSDSAIVAEVKKQTQSAFGALREANVGVNSRELKDVDPATFLKTPVTVVDRANPSAPPKRMTKVAYTFTDDAVVPIPMAQRSAISLVLISWTASRPFQSLC